MATSGGTRVCDSRARFASRIGWATLAGVTAGVAGLVGAFTFASGFVTVAGNANLWGTRFDVFVELDTPDAAAAAAVARAAGVKGVALTGYAESVAIGEIDAPLFGLRDVTGPFPITILRGRAPMSDGEVLLGAETAERAGLGLGDVVQVPALSGQTVMLQVVGTALVPVIGDGRYTSGVVVSGSTFDQLPHPTAVSSLWVTADVGVDADELAEELRADGLRAGRVEPPSEFHNLSPVRDYPVVVGIVLAVLGLAAIAGGVVSRTRRRRRESATLRALGLSSPQLFGAVLCGTGWTGCIATALGVPIGILLARRVWSVFANGLSLGAELGASWVLAAGAALGVTVVSVCLAILPALRSAHRELAADLRTE